MASGTSHEDIELQSVPVSCTVTSPPSDTEDDIECLPSELATAFPPQMSR